MSATKRTAIRAGYILAFDGRGHRLLRDGVVVVEGDHILAVGPRFDGTVDETVDARDRVVTPGLISTHAHIGGSPLDRSFIEDRGNPQFWFSGLFEMLPVRSEAQDEEGGRPTTASGSTWARPSAPAAGSRGTASARSGSGARSRGARDCGARWTSTRGTTAPTVASCGASSRPPRSTPAPPRSSKKRSGSRT